MKTTVNKLTCKRSCSHFRVYLLALFVFTFLVIYFPLAFSLGTVAIVPCSMSWASHFSGGVSLDFSPWPYSIFSRITWYNIWVTCYSNFAPLFSFLLFLATHFFPLFLRGCACQNKHFHMVAIAPGDVSQWAKEKRSTGEGEFRRESQNEVTSSPLNAD